MKQGCHTTERATGVTVAFQLRLTVLLNIPCGFGVISVVGCRTGGRFYFRVACGFPGLGSWCRFQVPGWLRLSVDCVEPRVALPSGSGRGLELAVSTFALAWLPACFVHGMPLGWDEVSVCACTASTQLDCWPPL